MDRPDRRPRDPSYDASSHHLERAFDQLEEYFAGVRRSFDLTLHFAGTTFQTTLWHGLLQIPYGETRTYGQLAADAGSPRAVRAAGQACRVNPIAILIPCHRVLGSTGKLVGYAGSKVHLKEALLEHERRVAKG